jgi:hypothetical protein
VDTHSIVTRTVSPSYSYGYVSLLFGTFDFLVCVCWVICHHSFFSFASSSCSMHGHGRTTVYSFRECNKGSSKFKSKFKIILDVTQQRTPTFGFSVESSRARARTKILRRPNEVIYIYIYIIPPAISRQP